MPYKLHASQNSNTVEQVPDNFECCGICRTIPQRSSWFTWKEHIQSTLQACNTSHNSNVRYVLWTANGSFAFYLMFLRFLVIRFSASLKYKP